MRARQRLTRSKMLLLEFRLADSEFGLRDGELGPGVEDGGGFGAGATLELGFDVPGEVGAGVFAQDGVGDEGVDIFGVDQQAVVVEEDGADWGEAGQEVLVWFESLDGEDWTE